MRKNVRSRWLGVGLASLALTVLSAGVHAQLPDLQPGRNFPTAALEFGAGRTENIDLGDADNDGDYDVAAANGGDGSNQVNGIYINQGGLEGGVVGTFIDESATRFAGLPADRSRDVEFADIDGDFDLDLYITNRGSTAEGGQVSRVYINQGGMQQGTISYFSEGTDAFWGQLVSVPVGDQVFGNGQGPWRDFACDCQFDDLDLDGDLDLFHSSYGPNFDGTRDSRVFLNDGTAVFHEMWPWADHLADTTLITFGIDVMDLDDDFDLDVFISSRDSQARVYRNNLLPDGSWPADPFTDMTQSAIYDTGATLSGTNNYECCQGDLDGDGDFDLWMQNYSGFQERILRNNGDFTFTRMDSWIKGDPNVDEVDTDLFDYDSDGDLDILAPNFSGTNNIYQSGLADGLLPSEGLYHRTGVASGGSLSPAPEVPSSSNGGTTLDADAGDLDNDGDPDAILGNDSNQLNRYWENVLGVPDTHAPTVHQLTVQGDKSDGSDTVVRVQLRDNASFYIIAFYTIDLMVSVDGGTENRLRMFSQGGQQFQATIPGELNGQIAYRVLGSDDNGNQFASATLSYQQTSSGTAVLQTLDDGTPGLYGNPWLWLNGSFVAGTNVTVGLTDGRPQSLAFLFLSLASTPTPFKGGLLHTVPIALELPLSTDLGGQLFLDVTWPVGVPVGTSIWYQYGIQDDTAFGGASLSNAVVSTQP